MITVESMIRSMSQVRSFYANELRKRLKGDYSMNELSILIFLHNNPHLSTSSQLAFFLEVSKGLISRSIESLCKKGLVEIVQDEKDKRVSHIYLSEQSLSLITRIEEEKAKINDEVFGDISKEKIEDVNEVIGLILDRLKGRE